MPDVAAKAGAAVTGSGRFDFPNQCNNVLAFPGLMRGAVAARATRVSHGMCLAAARAIADHVPESELSAINVLPSPLDPELCPRVAEAVVEAAKQEGLARRSVEAGEVAEGIRQQARHAARFQEIRLG